MATVIKVLMALGNQLKSQENRRKLLIIICIPLGIIFFFFSIFAVKSDDPRDVYLQAAEEVALELETINRLDGNLVKSIYFLYDGKRTEKKEEIKNFIKTFFVNEITENIWVPFGDGDETEAGEDNAPASDDENSITITPVEPDFSQTEELEGAEEAEKGEFVEVTYYAFKSYLEIQAMILLPPFSFSPPEMLLVNLYLITSTPDTGEIDPGEEGENTDDNLTGGGNISGDLGDESLNPAILPFRLAAPCSGSVTSYFGTRTHPVTGEPFSSHTGIDICGTHHQAIKSVADGVIVSASTAVNGYGNYIKIKHEIDGVTFYSFYAHLSKLNVHVGQPITEGQIIAAEGGEPGVDKNPGTSTGHHLHFEIRLTPDRSSCIDPAPYIGK